MGFGVKAVREKNNETKKKRIWEGHGLIDYLSLTSVFLAALKSQPEVRILRGGGDDLGNQHVFRLRRGDNEMSEDDDPLSCQSEADRPPGGGRTPPSNLWPRALIPFPYLCWLAALPVSSFIVRICATTEGTPEIHPQVFLSPGAR